MSTSTNSVEEKPKSDGIPNWLKSLGWDPASITESKDFNRWKIAGAATLTHVCLGSVFAWSIFNQPLMCLHGVVAPAASDWSMGDISLTFSLIMGGFAWGGLLSTTLDKWGPRASCSIGAVCLGTGFSIGAAAISVHSLPLLYLGGLIWGFANGWAYVPPVAALMKWFPDRKGFASGATIMGYGGGAMIAAPTFQKLLSYFGTEPTRLGGAHDVALINKDGHLFVDTADGLTEVVVATAADAAKAGLIEGVYAVGSGSTGAAETFLVLGAGLSSVMFAMAQLFRLPPKDFMPANAEVGANSQITTHSVSVETAQKTPQFALMALGFGMSITGSYGIISCGKTLLSESFSSSMPEVVTGGFCASFVAAMSLANLSGRIFWSNTSDMLANRLHANPFIGRKLAYTCMWGIGPVVYCGLVWSVHQAAEAPSLLPLGVFCSSVFLVLASFGGAAATRPALVSDLFGTKNMGVLTARQLMVVLPAAYAGPKVATTLREWSMKDAINDLSTKVSDAAFVREFGAGKEELPELIQTRAVSINRLMELVPPDTVDPTPFLYDNTMYVMAGMQTVAVLANVLTKPVDVKYHEPEAGELKLDNVLDVESEEVDCAKKL